MLHKETEKHITPLVIYALSGGEIHTHTCMLSGKQSLETRNAPGIIFTHFRICNTIIILPPSSLISGSVNSVEEGTVCLNDNVGSP